MDKIDELLKIERELYEPVIGFMRLFASHIRGINDLSHDVEMNIHLSACRKFYEMYGTTVGEGTPWIYREEKHGKKKENAAD